MHASARARGLHLREKPGGRRVLLLCDRLARLARSRAVVALAPVVALLGAKGGAERAAHQEGPGPVQQPLRENIGFRNVIHHIIFPNMLIWLKPNVNSKISVCFFLKILNFS